LSERTGSLFNHFDNLHQQKTSVTLGMWVFLATEVLFFGGLMMAYIFYRSAYPEAFVAASYHLDVKLGAFNTVVLIVSSLTMALAVHAAHEGDRRKITLFVIATMVLGAVFLGIKAYEYHHKWVEHLVPGSGFAFAVPDNAVGFETLQQHTHIFFLLYFMMTGLHATHMIIGQGIMVALLVWNRQGRFTKEYSAPVEVAGLYWHFVDIVWIFLFPLLYLVARH